MAGDKGHMDENELRDMLPLYYKRLFPFPAYYTWLSYGNVNKCFPRREFSFTLNDDIYVRYLSFADCDELQKEVNKRYPYKIDIGAVFNGKPKDHRIIAGFQPVEKEMVFDVDMTDYDEVRYCCSGADMCKKCWPFMVIAIKIVDSALREDFGYSHLLWVYSGRRGVHCWVCDEGARKLTAAARSAIADYLTVVVGGEYVKRKVAMLNVDYPFFIRSISIIKNLFEELHVNQQDFLSSKERWNKVLSIVAVDELRILLENNMDRFKNSAQRWEFIKLECDKRLSQRNPEKKKQNVIEEIMLQLCYPRLDVNVTKGLNHLLKSPFCIHPKTGRVCVPIDVKNLEIFNPFTVPTIRQLVDEINKYDAEMQMALGDADNAKEQKKRTKDYKKTSLCQGIEVFKDFVKCLAETWSGKRISKSDVKGDF